MRAGRFNFFLFFLSFFSFSNQVKAIRGIIASISPNIGADKSTLPKKKKVSHTSFKQVDNNNLKMFLKDKNSQKKKKKKKNFFGIPKIR